MHIISESRKPMLSRKVLDQISRENPQMSYIGHQEQSCSWQSQVYWLIAMMEVTHQRNHGVCHQEREKLWYSFEKGWHFNEIYMKQYVDKIKQRRTGVKKGQYHIWMVKWTQGLLFFEITNWDRCGMLYSQTPILNLFLGWISSQLLCVKVN